MICPDCGDRTYAVEDVTPGFEWCERCGDYVRPVRSKLGSCPVCNGKLYGSVGQRECINEHHERNWPRLVSATPKDTSAKETSSPLVFRTAADLASESPTEPPWLIKPFAASGVRTLISGKPKAAGKTTFLLRLIRSLTTGEPFLGETPEKIGPVVLLTEEGAISFTQALHRAGLEGSRALHVVRYSPGRVWNDTALEAIQYARAVGAVSLAVDTLPQWAEIPGDAENSAGIAREVFNPFTGVDDLAMQYLFHDRKSGGEPGEATRGSGAFTGAVDIIVDIQRVGGNGNEKRRELSMLGRFDLPDKLIVELGDDGYHLLGSTEDVRSRDVQRAVVELLDQRQLTESEIVDALPDQRRTTIQKALRVLHGRGEIERSGNGKRNDPYRYIVSATVPPYSVAETISETTNGHKGGHLARQAIELGARVVPVTN